MCVQHLYARDQRKHEVEAGFGLIGTKKYEDAGCYECDGYNRECNYFGPNEIPRK